MYVTVKHAWREKDANLPLGLFVGSITAITGILIPSAPRSHIYWLVSPKDSLDRNYLLQLEPDSQPWILIFVIRSVNQRLGYGSKTIRCNLTLLHV